MSPVVAQVTDAVNERFPVHWAEPWDQVGLLVGDPQAEVVRVFVTLDPTRGALTRAAEAGAQAVVTHHPAFLTVPERLTPRTAGVAFQAVESRLALIAAHTNLDRAPEGASALPDLLGLAPGIPLEDSALPVSLVTVYVPSEHEERIAAAMAQAGAGRIGEYRGCSFSAVGVGRFTPDRTSDPHTGTPGAPSSTQEGRLEMVTPRPTTSAVIAAAREAHPYEEPLIVVDEVVISRGQARMGRLSELAEPTTLAEVAELASRVFQVTPRVWGAREWRVMKIATATGSAGSLVPAAIASGADILIAGEVRYHDAQAAMDSGLGIIEIGHDVSEWPLVPILADAVAQTPGLNRADVIVDRPGAAWWTP